MCFGFALPNEGNIKTSLDPLAVGGALYVSSLIIIFPFNIIVDYLHSESVKNCMFSLSPFMYTCTYRWS